VTRRQPPPLIIVYVLAARRLNVLLLGSIKLHRPVRWLIGVDHWVVNMPAVNYCSSRRRP